MGFTTQIFIFVFFPICLAAYAVCSWLEGRRMFSGVMKKLRIRDVILVVFSLGFYMWACFDDVFMLIVYIVVVYLAAKWIEISKRKRLSVRLPVTTAIIGLILCLVYFKYTGMITQVLNWVSGGMKSTSIAAPLGLSFLTFSAVSYLVDISRGDAAPGSFLDCALYLSFFPKIVSGPIVLWKDFKPQISTRKTDLNMVCDGLNRMMIGFAKKVILADQFGDCLASVTNYGSIDAITAFGVMFLYMLQIYYDFSGYSDIAIGLAKLFGFQFKENFDFPYRSKSLTEFWRRWHISLGTWFREYVYFPLGGSRCSLKKTLRNLAIVFILTGIWHGAGWNFLIWGFLNGAVVILERVVADRPLYKKTPNWIKYICTMGIVLGCWQFFRFEYMGNIPELLFTMLGIIRNDYVYYTWQGYFNTRILVLAVVAIAGATVPAMACSRKIHRKLVSTPAGYALQEAVLLVLFALSILFMVNSTYSPFLYFQY